MDKLDPYSELLLCTQSINYLGHVINEVRLLNASSKDAVMLNAYKEKTNDLQAVVNDLKVAVEHLANYVNGCDANTELDCKLLDPVLKQLLLNS